MIVQLNLKQRIYLVNAVLLCVTVVGAVLMIWYTLKTEKIFKEILNKHIVVYQSAEALATDLVNQKGFVSYYLLDRDPAWFAQLGTYRKRFQDQLDVVKSLVQDDWEKEAVIQIQSKYDHYVETKDQVIELYKKNDTRQVSILHKSVRDDFARILDLCEQFKSLHKQKISEAIKVSREESNRLRYIALLAIVAVIVLSLMINYIFTRHILEPIRRLAEEADIDGATVSSTNELTALKHSVHELIETAEQTHEELKQSRETMMQSEKMALLGKLAAGTAHSIRNPLTSVNMRLFSLKRSCKFSPSQQEDFSVISGEITHINKIVENFLEFARPPRLRTVNTSPSAAVDSALHLLEQRLKSYHVTTQLIRKRLLADTLIDPEQLKEVIVNIIINACEAFDQGGTITIHEEEKTVQSFGRAAVIKIIDNGPGISSEFIDDIFNPFFTTKDEGTGLGLSIAFNIINEHGGWLDVSSRIDHGTSFIITLPVKDG